MTALLEDVVLGKHAGHAADRGADQDPRSRRIDIAHGSIRPRLAGGSDGEDDVPLESPRVLRPDDLDWIEVLHLGANSHRVTGGVERADPVDAAATGHRALPGRACIEPEGRDCSQTGDGDAAHETQSVVA